MRRSPCLLLLALACAPADTDSADDASDGADGVGVDGSDGSDGSADGADGGSTDYPTLLINELMSSNSATVADESGAFPDWVELYNPTGAAVSLGGWTISDDLDEPGKHTLAASLEVPAGGHLLLWADDDEEDGDEHLGFNLAAEGEQLGLYDPAGGASDEVEFGELGSDVSAARVPDGAADWVTTDSPTPGQSNGG